MVFLKHVLGTLLLALPILRSVSTSSGYVGVVVVSKCSDGRPKWCNKMLIKFPNTLARKCKTNGSKVRIEFCCETCKVLNSVTTEKSGDKTQHLMYTMFRSQQIYSYKVDVDQDLVKNGQYTIPFSTKFPGLAYNVQLDSLEIIGDWWSSSNKNHQMMTTAGSFSDASGSHRCYFVVSGKSFCI